MINPKVCKQLKCTMYSEKRKFLIFKTPQCGICTIYYNDMEGHKHYARPFEEIGDVLPSLCPYQLEHLIHAQS